MVILFLFGMFVIIVIFGFIRELNDFEGIKEKEFFIIVFLIMVDIFVLIFLYSFFFIVGSLFLRFFRIFVFVDFIFFEICLVIKVENLESFF